jgi:GR25 family glycosyltransferase involved in LPS biosynthesis
MKARVITIMDEPLSVKAAERCIRSAAKYDYQVEMFAAMTPSMEPKWYARKHRIPTEGFEEKYSRFENCLSAFISHYSLWQRCANENTP